LGWAVGGTNASQNQSQASKEIACFLFGFVSPFWINQKLPPNGKRVEKGIVAD
jgi:hypothetical protein